jgi:hypothetical protein
MAASLVVRTCCGRCDLDSEGDSERAWCQSRPLTRIMVRTDVSQRRGESESGNSDCVLGVRGRFAAPHILADERDRSDRYVVAAVVARNPQGCGLVLVFAAGRGLARMAPKLAQQPGVLPDCQRKRDGKYSCSKHVMLADVKGKSCASLGEGRCQGILGFSETRACQRGRPAEFRRFGAENPPLQSSVQGKTAKTDSGSAWHQSC